MVDRTGTVREDPAIHDGNGNHRPTKDIIQSIIGDVQEIIRSEVRLAKTEMKDEARKAGAAAGMFAGAGVMGLLAGMCVVTCCIAALSLIMGVWLAALIMTVLLGCTAGAMFAIGRAKMKQVNPVPQQTVQTLKEDARWARTRTI